MLRLKRIALLLFIIAVPKIFSQDFNFNIASIPVELKENANTVILFEDQKVEIHSQNSMTIKFKTAITVLNNLGDANRYVTVYFDKNQKIKNIETIIYNASGKEIKKIKNKEYNDVSAVDGGTLYGDNRVLYYKYTPISYPYTIYYEYEVETVNTGFVPSWRPISSYQTSIVKSTYQVSSTNKLKLRYKEKNFEGFKVDKNPTDFNLKYELKNQQAIKREPYSPSLENITPKLFVGLYKFNLEGINGEATNWKEFGKWRYDFLLNGNDELNEAFKTKIIELVEGVDEPIEKAKIIYEYVQGKSRYISVQEGIGGWMPIKADVVHKVGYGDCKGLSNYTKVLLDLVGVEAYYSIVWAGSKKSMEGDFFSMQGNHIILNLPTENEDVWLECTSQKVPFGYLGDFTDDRDVLVVTPEGGIIKHTKIYKSEENLQHTIGHYEINNDGSMNASVKISSHGTQYHDNLLEKDGASPTDLDVSFKQYFSNINNIKFSNIKVINNKENGSFDEELEFIASHYASQTDSEMLISVNAFNKFSNAPKRIRNRKLPFKIASGFLDIDEVKIKLPANLTVLHVPDKFELENKFGNYTAELIKVDSHNYIYKRSLQIEEGNHPKEEYENYRSFLKNIRKYDNSKIVLKKSNL